MNLEEHRLRQCLDCGRTWPDHFFLGEICKLCATGRQDDGLAAREAANRPPNEDRLRGIPPHPLTGARL